MIDQLWQEELRARSLVDEEIAPFLAERGGLLGASRLIGSVLFGVSATDP